MNRHRWAVFLIAGATLGALPAMIRSVGHSGSEASGSTSSTSLCEALAAIRGKEVAYRFTVTEDGVFLRYPPRGQEQEFTARLEAVGADYLVLAFPRGERLYVPYSTVKRVTIVGKPGSGGRGR